VELEQDTLEAPAERAQCRGNRLTPSRTNRLYYHLIALREAVEKVISQYFESEECLCLVDYGCGNMPYRQLFAPVVGRYVGCDMPGNPDVDVVLSEDGHAPMETGTVDAVLSTQVLEHVTDPAAYLSECHRMLRPEGLLVLSTHGVWKYHPDPCDYWRWTSSGLKRTVNLAGFEIVGFRGIMGPAATALQLWQDALVDQMPRFLRKPFVWCMQVAIQFSDRRCDKSVRNRDASVFMLVARKKNETGL
jgi:SAM-dependent methyltransferase